MDIVSFYLRLFRIVPRITIALGALGAPICHCETVCSWPGPNAWLRHGERRDENRQIYTIHKYKKKSQRDAEKIETKTKYLNKFSSISDLRFGIEEYLKRSEYQERTV